MHFQSQRLGTLHIRRSDYHDATRPNREPRWLEAFAHSPGQWVLHLGRVEAIYTTPREGMRLERRRLGPQLRLA